MLIERDERGRHVGPEGQVAAGYAVDVAKHGWRKIDVQTGLRAKDWRLAALSPVNRMASRQNAIRPDSPAPAPGADTAHVILGVLASVAIIVAAVLMSALTLGSYGWSLFVATPFLVGVTITISPTAPCC